MTEVVDRPLRVERMGCVAYAPMLALQEQRHADVLAGAMDDTLFLLEHFPVITRGRNAVVGNVLHTAEMLAAQGVALIDTGRGGDVTYHGPGQIVGYPIVHLQEGERDVRRYVCGLEEIMIRLAADVGLRAERVAGLRGVFVGQDKLGAVGVRLSRWGTMHGFALNVTTRLEHFGLIVPCGIVDRGVTSLAALLGADVPSMGYVMDRLVVHCGAVLGRMPYAAPPMAMAPHDTRQTTPEAGV